MLTERLGGVLAGLGLTAPAWMTTLDGWTELFALLASVLGCIWLIVQIACRIIETRRSRNDLRTLDLTDED